MVTVIKVPLVLTVQLEYFVESVQSWLVATTYMLNMLEKAICINKTFHIKNANAFRKTTNGT